MMPAEGWQEMPGKPAFVRMREHPASSTHPLEGAASGLSRLVASGRGWPTIKAGSPILTTGGPQARASEDAAAQHETAAPSPQTERVAASTSGPQHNCGMGQPHVAEPGSGAYSGSHELGDATGAVTSPPVSDPCLVPADQACQANGDVHALPIKLEPQSPLTELDALKPVKMVSSVSTSGLMEDSHRLTLPTGSLVTEQVNQWEALRQPVGRLEQVECAKCSLLPAPEMRSSELKDYATESERRGKRRRKHEYEVASAQRTDLRCRFVDAVCELEILNNEVSRLRSLSSVPAVEPEVALKPEHWSRLEANHRRRLQELAQRGCHNIVKGLMKHQWAVPFNTPVDTVLYPAYLDYIDTPMDFSLVRRKCESGAYGCPDDFAADMRLVFANARSYNKRGTDVFVMSTTLEEKFEEKWVVHVVPKLREEVTAQHREQLDTLRSLRAAAVAARGERLAAQSEAVGSALGRLALRLREAKSLAAQQCKPLSLPEKDELARVLPKLSVEHFASAMQLILTRHPEIRPATDTVLDWDRLDALTLRQLQSFVKAVGISASSPPEPEPEGAAPTPVHWPHLLASAGIRGYRARGSRKAQQAAAERVQILDSQQPESCPGRSVSISGASFSFSLAGPTTSVMKPPLFHAPQKGNPAYTSEQPLTMTGEGHDVRLERQLTAQGSGVGGWASANAAQAAVQRYNARRGELLRCGSSVGEASPQFTAAVIAAMATAEQRRALGTCSIPGPSAQPTSQPEQPPVNPVP